jgi:hypothetical protein
MGEMPHVEMRNGEMPKAEMPVRGLAGCPRAVRLLAVGRSRLAVAFLLPFSAATAQIVCALGTAAASYTASNDQRPTADAMELAGRMNAAAKTICGTNCPMVVVFRNSTAANAMLIANAGQAKLVYAPQFFDAAYDNFGDGGILGLIAHLLGHALDDTLGAAWIKSDWTPELRADAWAGCALARAGLGADELEGTIHALAKYPSPAHPSWSLRLPVLRVGYAQCGGDPAKFAAAGKEK